MLTFHAQLLHKPCKPLSAKPDSPAAKMTPEKFKGCHCDAKLPSASGMRIPSFFGFQRNMWDAPSSVWNGTLDASRWCCVAMSQETMELSSCIQGWSPLLSSVTLGNSFWNWLKVFVAVTGKERSSIDYLNSTMQEWNHHLSKCLSIVPGNEWALSTCDPLWLQPLPGWMGAQEGRAFFSLTRFPGLWRSMFTWHV